ncbi:MAG: 30S ribosomal protein S21 [Proteobacteria bacterium]|jgi:small subunit ribosomal protein S21|nr:30S ribosomal protein S21 [Pseudomonadota bacterium]
MAEVKALDGEDFERLLKRFKKEVEKAGILSELKKREFYEKPSERKKRRLKAARRRALKKARKEKMMQG